MAETTATSSVSAGAALARRSRTSASLAGAVLLVLSNFAACAYSTRGEARVDIAQVLVRDRPVGGGADGGLERDSRAFVFAALRE